MTDDEILAALTDAICATPLDWNFNEDLARACLPVVKAAVAAERERAAEIAAIAPFKREAMVCGCSEGLGNYIATAIRKGDEV